MANESALTKPMEFEVNGNEVKLSGNMVAQYLTRGDGAVSEQEVVMFMQLCKFQKLNPFLNEAYLVKFKGAPAQIIVSKEAFMKRAETHPQYDGLEAGIIVESLLPEKIGELIEIEGAVLPSKNKVVGGWAKVYRKDRGRPIVVKISLSEFSKGQATWKQMPLNMLRKTAIVNALREAFPDNVGALYTEEESGVSEAPKPVEDAQKEIDENANSKVLDFDQPNEKNIKPIKEVEKEEAKSDKAEFEQEALFNSMNPPLKNEPEF